MGELQADFQFWLYVIVGVIYLISRLRKKPAEQTDFPEYGPENPVPKPPQGQPGRVDTSAPRQLTFEELLQEITETKAEKKPLAEVPNESYEEVLVEEVDREEKTVSKNIYRDDQIVQAYEEAKRQAFLRPSLEETMDILKTEVKYGRFKEFEKEAHQNLVEVYLADFKDPAGLRKAVVMSEILKRKF
jgi:hypothetical protein